MQIHAYSSAVARPKAVAHAAFIVLFTALAIVVPTIFHQFNLAGPTFLPMHIFVFVAALTLGWRAGFVVGLLSPLISYSYSHMPPALILPQITAEIVVYGLAAGLLREYAKLNIYVSLLCAMVLGRLALGMTALLMLPNNPSVVSTVTAAVKIGWPGILLQLLAVPPLVLLVRRFLNRDHGTPPADPHPVS